MKEYTIFSFFLILCSVLAETRSFSQANERNLHDKYEKKEDSSPIKLVNAFFKQERFNKSYAIVIGLSDYNEWKHLEACYYDALKVRNYLTNDAKFDYVVTLTNNKAQKTVISKYMEEVFPKLLAEGDRFLFYFSGHGTQRKLGNRIRGYLPMLNSGQETWSDMISMDDIERWNENIEKAQHALFVLDCCFSGLAGVEKKGNSKQLYLDGLAQYAHHLITAGTANEESYCSLERWGGSLFTEAFIRGVSGGADAGSNDYPQDGIVSLSELSDYVKKRIKEEAAKDNRVNQSPQLSELAGSDGEFFFVSDGQRLKQTTNSEQKPEILTTTTTNKSKFINPETDRIEQKVATNINLERITKIDVSTARASSSWSDSYSSLNTIDGSYSSYWATKPDEVTGASLSLIFRNSKIVARVGIYTPIKPEGRTIKTATLTFSDGSSQQISLHGLSEWEYVDITPVVTRDIVLTVDEVNNVNDTKYVSIYELQLFGKSLSEETKYSKINTKIEISTARASSLWSYSYPGINVIDGNTSSFWATKEGETIGTSLSLLFRASRIVNRIGIYTPTRPDGKPIKTATLTFSDGSSQKINLRGLSEWEYAEIAPVTTMSIDLSVDEIYNVNSKNYVSLYEIQLFGKPSSDNETSIVKNSPINTKIEVSTIRASSSWSDSYSGLNAIDGNISSYWASKEGETVGTFLSLTLRTSRILNRIGLYTPMRPDGKTVRTATLVFSNESSQQISLRGLSEWEFVDITPVATTSIDIIIDEIYNTSSNNYVSIYEFQLLDK